MSEPIQTPDEDDIEDQRRAAWTLETAEAVDSLAATARLLLDQLHRAQLLLWAVQLEAKPGAIPITLSDAIRGLKLDPGPLARVPVPLAGESQP